MKVTAYAVRMSGLVAVTAIWAMLAITTRAQEIARNPEQCPISQAIHPDLIKCDAGHCEAAQCQGDAACASEAGVPVVSKIPFLGQLFVKTNKPCDGQCPAEQAKCEGEGKNRLSLEVGLGVSAKGCASGCVLTPHIAITCRNAEGNSSTGVVHSACAVEECASTCADAAGVCTGADAACACTGADAACACTGADAVCACTKAGAECACTGADAACACTKAGGECACTKTAAVYGAWLDRLAVDSISADVAQCACTHTQLGQCPCTATHAAAASCACAEDKTAECKCTKNESGHCACTQENLQANEDLHDSLFELANRVAASESLNDAMRDFIHERDELHAELVEAQVARVRLETKLEALEERDQLRRQLHEAQVQIAKMQVQFEVIARMQTQANENQELAIENQRLKQMLLHREGAQNAKKQDAYQTK